MVSVTHKRLIRVAEENKAEALLQFYPMAEEGALQWRGNGMKAEGPCVGPGGRQEQEGRNSWGRWSPLLTSLPGFAGLQGAPAQSTLETNEKREGGGRQDPR